MEPGPQFHQLAMFHTAEELKTEHFPMDGAGYGTVEKMWETKKRESNTEGWQDRFSSAPTGRTLHESIRQHGVQTPVQVWHGVWPSGRPSLGDGHHRVSVAHDIDPKMLLPVTHRESQRRR